MKGNGKEKRITISLPNNLVNDIDGRGDSRPATIEKDLVSLYNQELSAICELKGKFTELELSFLASYCVQGMNLSPSGDVKNTLLRNIASAFDAEILYEKMIKVAKEKDKENLMRDVRQLKKTQQNLFKKVDKLTYFHCYTIARIIDILFENSTNGIISTKKLYDIFAEGEPYYCL